MAEVWGGPCGVKGPQEGAVEVAPPFGHLDHLGRVHACCVPGMGWLE